MMKKSFLALLTLASLFLAHSNIDLSNPVQFQHIDSPPRIVTHELTPLPLDKLYPSGFFLPFSETDRSAFDSLNQLLFSESCYQKNIAQHMFLLHDFPEENIRLWGMTSSNYGMILERTKNKETISLHYTRGLGSEMYNINDVIYILIFRGTGTGVSISELMVIPPNDDVIILSIDDVLSTLNDLITIGYDSENKISIIFKNNLVIKDSIDIIGGNQSDWIPRSFFLGNSFWFSIENETVYLNFIPMFYNDALQNGTAYLSNISFLKAKVKIFLSTDTDVHAFDVTSIQTVQ